ncbi:MgtC/SapB family protein [Rhodococcus erythropolis]|uniref:MgtC/SapB family protein n=1 Tax=Rhodococcus erythropolis TaxID=1833 RepID=UPI0029493CCF|nr:MgtC/SapB family protein [Rhodococcus erythropolis]MDV6278235.1 MgtC/SapB family protein [Rhodococcus erythropolis]
MNDVDVPANLAEMVARIGIAFALGLAVGLERQWRARMAGLRTNVLVSVGSALFVLFGAYAFTDNAEADPTRVAAQVVSGIGFLGAGVIWRQHGSISGINTAATLWATAAVGVLSGGGLYVAAAAGTATIVLANTILRPLARTINRQPTSGREVSTIYTLTARCREPDEAIIRAMAVHAVSQPHLTLQSVSSEDLITDTATGPKTTVLVRVVIRTDERNDALLEKVVSTLSLEPGVSAVQWAVHEDDPADD